MKNKRVLIISKLKELNMKTKSILQSIEARISIKKMCYGLMTIVSIIAIFIISNVVINDLKTNKEYNSVKCNIDNYINKKEYDKALSKINYGIKRFKNEEKYIVYLKNKKENIKKLKENYDYDQYIKVAKSDNVEVTDDDRIDAYTKAIDVKPSEEEPYMQAASLFIQYNEYEKAINLLSSGVDACENNDSIEAKETAENLTHKIDEINELILNTEYNNTYLEAVKAYEEGNLDEVILKYNQCVLKNKNDSRLYVIMARAYFEKNKYSEAINILKIGIDRLKAIGANKKKSKQYDNYKTLVNIKKKYEAIWNTSKKYDSFYKKLLSACQKLKEKDNIEDVKKVILSYDFATIAACNDITYYTNKGAYTERINSGVGIAVYKNRYIYYGDWKDGKKSGTGYYFAISKNEESIIAYMYKGNWDNNYPHGSGTIKYELYKEDKLIYSTLTKGTFVKGYEDGDMRITKKGEDLEYGELTMKYKAKSGEPVIKTDKGKKLTSADGSYIIGYYYDKDNKKREVASIPVNENGEVKKVQWRVSGLSY